jgi:hypothetical protein|tara:strand:- start:107 stop:238 length:132 start_codon:yes stop_codon:yes gene_type:complete
MLNRAQFSELLKGGKTVYYSKGKKKTMKKKPIKRVKGKKNGKK